MKRILAALLLFAALPAPCAAFAQAGADEPVPMLARARWPRVAPQALRTSAGPDPDTVYVGYSQTDHWNATSNYWNLWTGTRRPGTNNPENAIWDWDNLGILASHGVGDSLSGWWPDRLRYGITGGLTLPDDQRPWWAIDIGNMANYVVNAGPGGKRTYGVVGVWHADAGRNEGVAVQWTPLSGTKSAWCGLRQLNDVSVLDQVTRQPFNQAAIERGIGTNRGFPGYANQWDQMLYRDVIAPAGQPLGLSFLYRTRMSKGVVTAAASRTGWFHGDPLNVVTGNFISSTAAGANAPIDSFSVYAGVPVDEASCTYSDGSVAPVYDVQRRWFSEVLRLFDGSPYYCLFSAAGNNPADTAGATPTASVTLPAAGVDAIRAVSGGAVRIVFRVKTNRGYADGDGAGGFSSASRGAVLLDDVTVNGAVIGDFEKPEQGGMDAIDNRIGASPLTHWKSTGKSPTVYFHLGNLEAGINYSEMCGAWDSPARICDIRGNVLMAGNYDVFEALMDPRYLSDREGQVAAWSPTINMTVDRTGGNAVNAHGLTESIVTATADICLFFDVYAGQANLPFTGVSYMPGFMVYPVLQANGASVWSGPILPGFAIIAGEPVCEPICIPLGGLIGIPPLANDYNVPDSLRVMVGVVQQCFRYGVTLGCNDNDGMYFDNVSVAFVDNPAIQASASNALVIGPLTIPFTEWFADVFPANESAALPASANFDTAAALIKGPVNTAAPTTNQLRFCTQPDTVLITAMDGSGSADPVLGNTIRLDLVFRILPGPGNYAIASPGGRTFPPTPGMQLLDVPTDQSNFVTAGDGSFWGEYMAGSGVFGKGDHHGGTWWDHLTWNSARCDTAEKNVFPVAAKVGGVAEGLWASMLHEEDPHFATLGIDKFRCFMVDTAGLPANANIVCDGTVPAWLTAVPSSRTGWDGSATTKEYTKIIPDGLLTPGAHVQYFYRKSMRADSVQVYTLVPDTNAVAQFEEGNFDGHRWQQFGVLPDRWKDIAFGGSGMACMLYVDWCDRWGTELEFVTVMDSLGGTAPAKFGAHNGWHAPSTPGPMTWYERWEYLAAHPVHGRNQQPGTTWDMYGVKAAESIATSAVSPGARLANRAGMGYATGRQARTAPTPEMLRRFYRLITILSGPLNGGIMGPYLDHSQDDVALLGDFLTGNDLGSTPQPRGLFVGGNGFVQSAALLAGQNASQGLFLSTKLGLTLRNPSYQAVSNNTNDCADLITTSLITPNGDVYGVGNFCMYSSDLLQRNPAITESAEAAYYENTGVAGPYVAAVAKPANASAGRDWVAYTEGWDLYDLWGRYCETPRGRLAYYWNVYNRMFAEQCQATSAGPVLDVPTSTGGAPWTTFLKVGNSVVRSGAARIRLGLASPDHVRVSLYDVAGRRVRTLADRAFPAGEHELLWDGADDAGGRAPRGVYFARVEYATLRAPDAGRIVLLR